MAEKEFWLIIRQALLMVVDAIERKYQLSIRTSDARKAYKNVVQ